MKYLMKENRLGGESPFKTWVSYEKGENSFRFKFESENSKLYSVSDKDNAELFRGDVCEVFISTGGKIDEYYEIEVAPSGAVFFAKVKHSDNGNELKMLEKNFKTEVKVDGNNYSVEIEIPFESVDYKGGVVYFNAYRIETEGGIADKNLIALFPTLCGTFHTPSKFGVL